MNAVSYGLIVVLVSLAILGALANVGTRLQFTFCTINAHLAAPIATTTCANERKAVK